MQFHANSVSTSVFADDCYQIIFEAEEDAEPVRRELTNDIGEGNSPGPSIRHLHLHLAEVIRSYPPEVRRFGRVHLASRPQDARSEVDRRD